MQLRTAACLRANPVELGAQRVVPKIPGSSLETTKGRPSAWNRCTGYPSASEEWDVTVQSWVRADRSSLDVPLADAVAHWLATDWPWERVDRCGR